MVGDNKRTELALRLTETMSTDGPWLELTFTRTLVDTLIDELGWTPPRRWTATRTAGSDIADIHDGRRLAVRVWEPEPGSELADLLIDVLEERLP